MASTIGSIYKVTTFGESHGLAVGAVVDGCPAGIKLTEADIQPQLTRRRPGQSDITTPRDEKDKVKILSGTEGGETLGTPISMVVENENRIQTDYEEMSDIPRPSHGDYTYRMKYGVRARSGGGRASARETVGRVAAGAVAEKILGELWGIDITAWVSSVGEIEAPDFTENVPSRAEVDSTLCRCPDPKVAAEMIKMIEEARDAGDSRGGVVTCVCRNVPAGWGEPVFDKIEAMLARAMLSIPATKGFEIGSGFKGTLLKGSEHNDAFIKAEGGLGTATNRSGGVQAGISNGEPIIFRVAFKPVATVKLPQETVDFQGNPVVFDLKNGRHDPCVLPRAVPIVESMAAMVLADMGLAAKANNAG